MALKKVGAIWIREKGGKKMLSLKFDEPVESCIGFANSYKKESKHPDYQLYVVEDEQEQPSPSLPNGKDEIPF